MMSGVARSVLRSASPAVVVVMKVLSRPPTGVGEVNGWAPTDHTVPTTISRMK